MWKLLKWVGILFIAVVAIGAIGGALGAGAGTPTTVSTPTPPPPDDYEEGYEADSPRDHVSKDPLWQPSDGYGEIICEGETNYWDWGLTAYVPPGSEHQNELNAILHAHDGRPPLSMLEVSWGTDKDETGVNRGSLSGILVRTTKGRILLDFDHDDAKRLLDDVGLTPYKPSQTTDLQTRAIKLVEDLGPTTLVTTSLPIDKILSLHVVGADDDRQRCRFE